MVGQGHAGGQDMGSGMAWVDLGHAGSQGSAVSLESQGGVAWSYEGTYPKPSKLSWEQLWGHGPEQRCPSWDVTGMVETILTVGSQVVADLYAAHTHKIAMISAAYSRPDSGMTEAQAPRA